MDEWKQRIEEWHQRLAEWQRTFDARYAELARRRAGLFRSLSDGEKDELQAQARQAAGEELARELFAFVSELCDAYRAEPLPQPRAKVRAWIGNQPTTLNALLSYAHQALELARGADAQRMLERGLAALSIVDVRTDFLAVQALLGRYWIALRGQGLDASAAFATLAKLSNPGMGGGGACLGQIVREFGSSAYFREHVRPQLPRASA
ncbi:MAG: hypothetical protein IT454_10275 [Planctomycetes bacterium]|nr:hypothetical protein [Planctomycetota bacterium]